MKGILRNDDLTIGLVELEEKDAYSVVGIFDLDYIKEVIKFCGYFDNETISLYKVVTNKGNTCFGMIPGKMNPNDYHKTMICVAEIDTRATEFDEFDKESFCEMMLHYGYGKVTEVDKKISQLERQIHELNIEINQLKSQRKTL